MEKIIVGPMTQKVGESAPCAKSNQDNEDLFQKFWRAYPKRRGSNPKSPARAKFMTALRLGNDPAKIIAGAVAYAKELGPKVGSEFVCMAVTWLNQRRWQDYEAVTPRPIVDADALIERYRQKRIREGWE